MDLNSEANRQGLIGFFPELGHDGNFTVESPETDGYNCIAWAMGFDDRWVDYIEDGNPKKWWPEGVPRDWLPETLVQAFEAVGFEPCGMDDSLDDCYDKAALYMVKPFFEPISHEYKPVGWCHAARVVDNGMYHSKIGRSFDIHHRSGDVFSGTSYGEVYQIMCRPKERRGILERIMREQPRLVIPDNIVAMILARMAQG